VSHQAYIGVLAHHEPRTARPSSHVPADQAELLVDQLVAEPVSQRVIRMLAPSSTFLTIQREPTVQAAIEAILPTGGARSAYVRSFSLSPPEIPGLRFVPPESQRLRYVAIQAQVRAEFQNWLTQSAP
jgi:hypothetical protein